MIFRRTLRAAARPKHTHSRKRDWFSGGHFCVWLVFGAIFYVSDELDRLLGLWLLLVPLIVVPGLAALGTFVVGLTANMWRRRWWQLVSVIAAPSLTIGLLAASISYQINTDWIRFQLTRSYYMKMVKRLPGPSPKFQAWAWGDTGGAGAVNIFHTLVYDETDRPLERPVLAGHEGATSTARPYGHHFFLVTDIQQ